MTASFSDPTIDFFNKNLFALFEQRWVIMLGIRFIEIFHVHFHAFAGEGIHSMFLDDFSDDGQRDAEYVGYLFWWTVGFSHEKMIR